MREHPPADPAATPPTAALTLDAFSVVVDQRQAALYAFLHGLVGDAEQARDLTQDAFHDAWRATQAATSPWNTDHNDDERRRWLFHTAYCRAASQLRRHKVIRWASLDALDALDALDWSRPDAGAGHRTLASSASTPFEERLAETEALRAALARLRPDDAACLLLRVAQGFSAAETADVLGVSVNAVGQRLARARRRLRAIYLEQNPPDATDGAASARRSGDE